MTKILGLDLGTNSIGWAIVDREKGEETILRDKGVLIFTEGVKSEKGIESSRAAARTEKRSIRRIKFRRKLRKYETLLILANNEMCPLTEQEVIAWRKSGFKTYPTNDAFLNWLKTDDDKNVNPYYFRDRASKQKANKLEVGRALYHIAQRRGFWSNRLDKSDEGIVESHKPELLILFSDAADRTDLVQKLETYFIDIKDKKSKELDAGEQELKKLYNFFVKHKLLKDKNATLHNVVTAYTEKLNDRKNLGAVKGGVADLSDKIKEANCTTLGQYFWLLYQKGERIRDTYTDREKHYLHEFFEICRMQGFDEKLEDSLERAIFYQRPLKSQKGLVGKCSLEPSKPRCAVSHPDFEEFRMLSFVNSIKILNQDGKKDFLTDQQREAIKGRFLRKSKPYFDFEDIAKTLKVDVSLFNYSKNTTVSGCPTSAALKNLFGEEWKDKSFKYTNQKGEEKTYDYKDLWHVLLTFDTEQHLYDFAKTKLSLLDEDAKKFSRITLKSDYAALSLKAINKILPYLRDGLLYSHAVFMANMANVVNDKWKNIENRELIERNIKEIIDNHQIENKINFVINSCIKNCKDKNYTFAKESAELLKQDLNAEFEKEFGVLSWSSRENKETILEEASLKLFVCLQSTDKEKQFVSIKRIDEKVINFLDDNDLLDNRTKLFHPSDLESFKPETVRDSEGNIRHYKLGSPVTGSIKNPMAMRSLFQQKKVINTLLAEGKIDEHTVINIELARELNDANKRKAIKNWQNSREDLHKVYKEKIKELYKKETKKEIEPSKTDIEKFELALQQNTSGLLISKEDVKKMTLWNEQNHVCLYSGKTIGLADFLGKNPNCEIEHTIPRSLSYDNTMGNLTLAFKRANNLKGNKIPYEIGNGGNGLSSHQEILARIAHWKKIYEGLETKIKQKLRATKAATTKDQKDKRIQERHELKLEYDYWKGKYDRFVMKEVPSGFARRQLTDIGIITKYARAYLKSVFPKVYAVKGTMVAEFRKAWGLHDKDEKGNYIVKNRDNHTHHCKDAITIACMDKYKYDRMAEYWKDAEQKGIKNERLVLKKPWKTFAEDVRNIDKEILVVHHKKNVAPIQSKKKLRKRGKIQLGKNDKPIYQQGDTIRGSLHKDTFYGAIATKDTDGNIKRDKQGDVIPTYVERVKLESLKKSQVEKIVDPIVRSIIENAAKEGLIKFGNASNTIDDAGIWMNKEKGVAIKKVRVFVSTSNPIEVKEHRDKKEGKEYKHHYFATNDENYCMAIYEGLDKKGNTKRTYEIVNMMDAAAYFKLSNKNHDLPLVPEEKKGLQYRGNLMTNKLVLFYENTPEEIWELDQQDLVNRLYRVRKMASNGQTTFQHHQEARKDDQIKADYSLQHGGVKAPGKLTTGESKLSFGEDIIPIYQLSPNSMNMLIDGLDFRITTIGIIEKI